MFDRIVYISDKDCDVKLKDNADVSFNLMNLHIIFEDENKKILGEVDDLKDNLVKVRFLGEITSRGLLGGVIRKPTLDAKVRVIDPIEVPLVTGRDRRGYMLLGSSPFYDGKDVFVNVNGFFSNHFSIFGNSGSGKSCGVTRIFQNMFKDERLFPYKSNIIMFDSSGEYYNAFKNLSSINPNYNYRFISTNETEGLGEPLRLPIYLLNVDDMALLLNATSHSQLPIIERMLKLAKIFSEEGTDTNAFKNHLIARAIMTILYTNETAPNKRNEIFSILADCSTPEFNLEAEIKGVGYTRKFRDCFLIDQFGNFTESVLMTEYVSSFIKEEYDSYEPQGNVFYTLDTLEKALNFTLISEGWLRNENTYGDSVTIKVRLHALITGENAKFFDYKDFVTLEQYISSLLIVNGKKYQLVNINLDDIDDVFAKVIVKVYSRLIFSFSKSLGDRASIPFHLIVEEAHRYIQNDTDTFLIGYNIFDRIAKEGRKYGVILGLITQRPVEMSDTVISQCSNFLIFKINHPADVEYIRKMVPNISDEIVEKQKTLQSGTCLAFGQAFKIPLIVKLEMPDPEPRSGNCDVVNIWDGNTNRKEEVEESDEDFVKKIEDEVSKKLGSDISSSTVSNDEVVEDDTSDEVEEVEENVEAEVDSDDVKEETNESSTPDIPVADSADEEESEGVKTEEESNDEQSDNDENSVDDDLSESDDDEKPEDEQPTTENTEEVSTDDNVTDEVPPVSEEATASDVAIPDVPPVGEETVETQTTNDDSMIIPVPGSSTETDSQSENIEVPPIEVPSMEAINSNILAGLDGLQQNTEVNAETQDVPVAPVETPVIPTSVVPEINSVPNNDVNSSVVTNDVGIQTPVQPVIPTPIAPTTPIVDTPAVADAVSPIPDANVVVPNMTPPENAQNVNLGAQLGSQEGLSPDVKPEEKEQPSIIIPGGQNVDSSILAGFGGQAQMADSPVTN